jgi:hypothetical protein
MANKLSAKTSYRIRARENFYAAMRADVQLLAKHRAYVSLTTVIVCCLDALAAGPGKATRGKFNTFVANHFPGLCADLERAFPRRAGADTLYDGFRNGFAHLRAPKSRFAIAEDHELDGAFAGEIEVDGVGSLVALNVDRLARDFLALLNQLDMGTGNSP